MEIWTIDKNGVKRTAYYMNGNKPDRDGKTRGFRCFPQSCNNVSKAVSFETVEEAAKFLKANPSWGIRMRPGTAIFYDKIEIGGVRR